MAGSRQVLAECIFISRKYMKAEEAIVYVLASSGRGMTAEQIAGKIDAEGLHRRKDGLPVSVKQVYAVVLGNPQMFCFSDGRIRLVI